MKYIVVGNSAAGLFAVEEIRRRDQESAVTVLTSDTFPSYSRCLTTYYLAGDIPLAHMYLRPDDFADKLGISLIYGTVVTGLDTVKKVVFTQDGREWDYDKLLLATGASAAKTQVPGADFPEVFTLRTLDDALKINSYLTEGKKATVIGGGLVALKSAYALLKRGLGVTVIVSSSQLLSQMLDAGAAGLIQRHLERHGMQIILGTDVGDISGKGHVDSVHLTDGREIPTDLIIVGKGVRPNTAYLDQTGISLGQGVRVNSYLETNHPGVYAAGDVAETWDRVHERYRVNATWPNATTQGRIAGANMTGAGEVYPGSLGLNSVDFFGLSAISAGITRLQELLSSQKDDTEKNSDTNNMKSWNVEENLKFRQDGTPVYQRLVWYGDILKGYVLVGNTAKAGVLTTVVREGLSLKEGQKNLSGGLNLFRFAKNQD